MELDDLKTAWQTLDRRLQQRNMLDLQLLREHRLDKARTGLRPLYWGQIAQILFGVMLVLLGVAYWTAHRGQPVLLTMGIALHAFGVVTAVMAGITIGQIGRIDYTAPVVAIQKRLAALRRAYVITGMVAGLSWWLMWMPFTTVVFGLLGADLSGLTFWVYLLGTLIGIAGLLATAAFHRWSRSPAHARWGKALDDTLTGKSLRTAMAHVEEIARFERE